MLKHEVQAVVHGVWCISEFGLVNAFVIEGDRRSAIIDTGCGYGNIRDVAGGLTSLPFSVLLTHKHPDHVGGIYHFKDCTIYMNDEDKDLSILGMGLDNAFRRMYAETRGPIRCPGRVDELLRLIPEPEPDCSFDWTSVDDGSTIDLGGRKLLCIHTPGHTEGSVCYLDEDSRILFSGDTVNKSIILMRRPDNGLSPVEKLDCTLRKIWRYESRFDSLAIGHEGVLIDKHLIEDYLAITSALLDGTLHGGYEEKGFRKGDVVRHGGAELWYRCDS